MCAKTRAGGLKRAGGFFHFGFQSHLGWGRGRHVQGEGGFKRGKGAVRYMPGGEISKELEKLSISEEPHKEN